MSVIKCEEIGNENENHGQLLKKNNNNIFLFYEQEEEEEPHGSRWEERDCTEAYEKELQETVSLISDRDPKLIYYYH